MTTCPSKEAAGDGTTSGRQAFTYTPPTDKQSGMMIVEDEDSLPF
jgi:hypothetical protein